MAYPQELVNEVLDYLDSGHSVREAERRFGVGHESAARWRRLRDGSLRANRPHPVKYPKDTVRLALGLAYGGHGFGLDEVAVMVGVSAPTISNWKRRYVEGGHMDIPEIDLGGIKHLSPDGRARMTGEELEEYIHKLELKAAVLEGTVKVLKAEGIDDLSNDEKAAIVDALPASFTVTEALPEVGLSSSSYYYCKAKPERPDRYGRARAAIREEFALVGGKRGYRYIRQRLREREDPIVVSGKTVRRLMAEEGCRVSYAKKRRSYSSHAGEISAAPDNLVARDFHAGAPEREVAHRHHAVLHPRRQGVPESRDRLLRRDARRVEHRGEPERGAGELHAGRGLRAAVGRRASRMPRRPRLPLPMARMDRHLRRARHRPVDVQEGVLARQLRLRGILRKAEERVLLRPRLGGSDDRGLHRPAGAIHEILSRRAHQGVIGLDESNAVQEIAWLGGLASPEFGAHPRTISWTSQRCPDGGPHVRRGHGRAAPAGA